MISGAIHDIKLWPLILCLACLQERVVMTRISKESKVVPAIDQLVSLFLNFFSIVLIFTMQSQMELAAYLQLLWGDTVYAPPSWALGLLLAVSLRQVMWPYTLPSNEQALLHSSPCWSAKCTIKGLYSKHKVRYLTTCTDCRFEILTPCIHVATRHKPWPIANVFMN